MLVLNGMCRLLKAFFTFFNTMENFKQGYALKFLADDAAGFCCAMLKSGRFDAGWDSLLFFIQESINTGSKEVALAAIAALHTVVLSHAAKVKFES